jgi:transposase
LWSLSDEHWKILGPLLEEQKCPSGKPLRDTRQVVDGIIYRYRAGIPWRDLPADFGPWQTVWKRHNRYSHDGTWDAILTVVVGAADASRLVDWTVAVDSTIVRAHQHATNTKRDTGGSTELQESGHRAA